MLGRHEAATRSPLDGGVVLTIIPFLKEHVLGFLMRFVVERVWRSAGVPAAKARG